MLFTTYSICILKYAERDWLKMKIYSQNWNNFYRLIRKDKLVKIKIEFFLHILYLAKRSFEWIRKHYVFLHKYFSSLQVYGKRMEIKWIPIPFVQKNIYLYVYITCKSWSWNLPYNFYNKLPVVVRFPFFLPSSEYNILNL